jgi:hypothetical protein
MFDKSPRQIKLENLVAAATEAGAADEDWVKRAVAELERLNDEPVERHHHTFIIERTRGGAVRRLHDQYRVERIVKPAVSQAKIDAIKAAFKPGHDVIETARLMQSIRDETDTFSWTQLGHAIAGTDDQTAPERRYWGNLTAVCLHLAYLAGEPVYLRPNAIISANRRLAPLSVEVRAELWAAMCAATLDEVIGSVFWRPLGYGAEGATEALTEYDGPSAEE